jgi:LmbE family N-acetylglucosaminyl deacetylase
MQWSTLFVVFSIAGLLNCRGMGETNAARPSQGAGLLKTDIMGVFAHPDDETGMAATLAYYALGKTSVVVNVYCTRGEGGGNMVGTQWGASLGILRETELRDCLATLGVRSWYFLDRLDWAYTESVAATLRKWDKEATLERLVRLVRALRPDVIVTMNPAPTPGQHGHHQAAGVLATEAFTAAANASRFPEQLAKEGLGVWQARRLFFGGGSGDLVATIQVNERLSNGATAAHVARQALVHHRSQGFGNFGDSPWMQRPQRFTLAKAFVPMTGIETNLLAGLPIPDSKLARVPIAKALAKPVLELEFQPPAALLSYRHWIEEQGIEHVAAQFAADLPVVVEETNYVRLQFHNRGPATVVGELGFRGPGGWTIAAQRRVRADAGTIVPIDVRMMPADGQNGEDELTAILTTGATTCEARAKLHRLPRARAVRLTAAPALDGTDRGWEKVPVLSIGATNIVQGKVTEDADSSATFRLGHAGKTLFIDVQVSDDIVVTNIAPNDIRGHWRSDSVEICLDPVAGAENTLGCFKLGIFPFDTSGVVRAARDADANQGPVEETSPRTRVVSRRTANGYRLQVSIPFDEIGMGRETRRLGFNLIIYDGDKRTAVLGENINESRIAWAPGPGVQGRPKDWGRIDLE